MARSGELGEVTVELDEGSVATAAISPPPHNFFDLALIMFLSDAFEALDADPSCRSIGWWPGSRLASRRCEKEGPCLDPPTPERF
jgi:hypothetical protein